MIALDASLRVLYLVASARSGGGNPESFGVCVSAALDVVLANESALRTRAWSLAKLLLDLLSNGVVTPDYRHKVIALQLRSEDGMVPNWELPLDLAQQACVELRDSRAQGSDADDLRIEIARRCVSGRADRWPGDRDDVDAMLEEMVSGECDSKVHEGRACHQLGNLLWRSLHGAKSPEALADYERGIELLRRARELLSRPGSERYLVEVLQTLGDALSLQSGHDELLAREERVAILREALTICEDPDFGSLRRRVLGTIGRLKIDMAAMHTGLEQRDLRHKHALAAIDYFQSNWEESDLNGDREGSLKMPSHLVMAYFFADDFEQMSHVLKIAQKRFEQFDPDGDPRFLAAGEFALAAQLKENPSQAELREIMNADNPIRDWLVSVYAPHLDWLKSKP